jgi:hypothetical protein
MFCPQCGSKQPDELKFCNLCGANLYAVRQVVATRETEEKFDWNKTWVADMLLSDAERKKRQADFEQERGLTYEVKRYNEIKAGVITSCVGVGVSIFLYGFMEAIVRSSQNPPGDEPILRAIWLVGVIPLLIGLALIINGLFVSSKLVEIEKRERLAHDALGPGGEQPTLKAADIAGFVTPDFSVTEGTTKSLSSRETKR